MKLNGALVPQADNLIDVGKVVEAVSKDVNGDTALGSYIGKNDRQGRYYRLAAESIGLLYPVNNGLSSLTPAGQKFVQSSRLDQSAILTNGVMSNPVMRGILGYLRIAGSLGRSRAELASWIAENTELSGETPARRLSSVQAWLVALRLATREGGNLTITKSSLPMSSFAPEELDPELPLANSPARLMPYANSTVSYDYVPTDEEIFYWVSSAKHDRANKKHEEIVQKLARVGTDAGMDCRRNEFVDLAAFTENEATLFEVKTNNPDNTVSQVRKAVAQLYEYQYQQQLPDSNLCLVLETKPTTKHLWIIDYLTNARGIQVVWEDGSGFSGPSSNPKALAWLHPQL